MQAKPGGEVKEALQKLMTHLQTNFPYDFPFYIVLAYRIHWWVTFAV